MRYATPTAHRGGRTLLAVQSGHGIPKLRMKEPRGNREATGGAERGYPYAAVSTKSAYYLHLNDVRESNHVRMRGGGRAELLTGGTRVAVARESSSELGGVSNTARPTTGNPIIPQRGASMRNLRLVQARRNARRQMKRHDDAVRMRRLLEMNFEKRAWHDIKVHTARMTIGEPYNRARMFEAIITFRGQRPCLIPLAQACHLVAKNNRKNEKDTHRMLHVLAREWKRERKPVRHPKWRG